MKTPLPAITISLCTALLALTATAEVYKIGDSFIGFSAKDQQGKPVLFKAGDAGFILFDSPAEGGSSQHPQDPDWFAKNRAWLVINISQFSAIKRNIAKSRMKSKPFQLLIVEDKDTAARFPTQQGKFTVLVLDDKGAITAIKFAAPGPELKEAVTGTQS